MILMVTFQKPQIQKKNLYFLGDAIIAKLILIVVFILCFGKPKIYSYSFGNNNPGIE